MSRHVDGTLVTIPFGKHRGECLEDIPVTYLDWLVGQEWFQFKFDGLYRKVCSYLSDPAVARELDAQLERGNPFEGDE